MFCNECCVPAQETLGSVRVCYQMDTRELSGRSPGRPVGIILHLPALMPPRVSGKKRMTNFRLKNNINKKKNAYASICTVRSMFLYGVIYKHRDTVLKHLCCWLKREPMPHIFHALSANNTLPLISA